MSQLSDETLKKALKVLEVNNQDPFYPAYNSQHTINAIDAYWKRTDPAYVDRASRVGMDEREKMDAYIRTLPNGYDILLMTESDIYSGFPNADDAVMNYGKIRKILERIKQKNANRGRNP